MDTMADRPLLAVPDSEFRSIVDDAIRGQITDEVVQQLKSPEIVERTYLTLVSIKKNVEGQLAAKKADYIKTRSLLHGNVSELRESEEKYQTWRAGALRFKSGVEEFMVSIRGVREKAAPPENYYLAFHTLKQAITQHRDHWCGDGCNDECTADQTLWSVLAEVEDVT